MTHSVVLGLSKLDHYLSTMKDDRVVAAFALPQASPIPEEAKIVLILERVRDPWPA